MTPGEGSAAELGRSGERAALWAFFSSGAGGVMHEVVWSRQLVPLIGAEAHAQAVALAVFMAGLSAGALLIRRRADRPRPLRTYAWLELYIAGYALATPLLLWAAAAGYLALARAFFHHEAARLALRFALTILILAPPATLMGATLPLLAGALARAAPGLVRRRVSALYAANCAGAVFGTALAGFVALPLAGVWGALGLAALANVAAAALVGPFARRELPSIPLSDRMVSGTPPPQRRPERSPVPGAVLLGLLFLSSLCAMGYEVLCVRLVALVMGSSSYAFTVMLLCFIAGIALGSALVTRLPLASTPTLLGFTQLGIVLAFLAALPLLVRLPYLVDRLRVGLQGMAGGFELHLGGSALLCLAVLLLPTVLLGFAFPLVTDLHLRASTRTGAGVGLTYAVGTAGNVAGVFLASLLLLPRAGLERAFAALWALQLAGGLVLLLVAAGPSFHRLRPRLVILALAIAAAVLYWRRGTGWSETLTLVPDHILLREGPPPGASPAERAQHPAASLAAWKRRYLLSAQRDRFRHILLAEDAHNSAVAFGPDRRGSITLAVNNKTDASTSDDLETQLLLGHASMLLAPRPRTALVVGHGVGITTAAVLRHRPDRVDLVEISPAVLRLDPLFASDNDHVLEDPHLRVYVDDGQSFLRAAPGGYDVIISEPSNPWIAGVGDLFTVDFFRAARARLNPDGVFTFWFHTYAQTDDTTRLLLRSLGSVFPHAELWSDSQVGNIIAVAALRPMVIDFAELEQRFTETAVARDMERIQVPSLAAFLTLHRRSQSFPWEAVGPGPVNTIARERLRTSAPRALFAGWSSFFVEQHDPLLLDSVPSGTSASASLFERYLAHRASRGDPFRAEEYETVASWVELRSGYGPALASRLRARARTAASP
jgi:spermidine synthase